AHRNDEAERHRRVGSGEDVAAMKVPEERHEGVSRASTGCVTFLLRDQPPSREEFVGMRVLELLNDPTTRGRRWRELQNGLGGRVRPDELRRAVNSILESGEAVVAWDVFSSQAP